MTTASAQASSRRGGGQPARNWPTNTGGDSNRRRPPADARDVIEPPTSRNQQEQATVLLRRPRRRQTASARPEEQPARGSTGHHQRPPTRADVLPNAPRRKPKTAVRSASINAWQMPPAATRVGSSTWRPAARPGRRAGQSDPRPAVRVSFRAHPCRSHRPSPGDPFWVVDAATVGTGHRTISLTRTGEVHSHRHVSARELPDATQPLVGMSPRSTTRSWRRASRRP